MPQAHSVSGDETDDKRGGGKSKAHTSKDVSHVPCKFFRVGSCTAGPACPFSHSAAEPGQHKQVCAWFVKGSCKFAHKCALAHVLPGQPMSMDRKNKKAAQQAGGGAASSSQPAAQGGSGGAAGEESREGGSTTTSRGGERDRPHRDRPPRERSQRTRENGDRNGRGGGSRGDHPLVSSTATLRPPIHIGKAPTISAAVTAPAVTSTTSFAAHSDEIDPDKDRATASLEQLQAHSHMRQSTITQENVALSDYSKTPSATTAPLPPQPSTSPKTEMSAPGSGSSVRRSVPLPTSSPRTSTHLHHSHVPRESDFGPIGSPSRADLGHVGSPPQSGGAGLRNDFGPIGSPPKANHSFSATTNPGVGGLSSLLAGLRAGGDSSAAQHHTLQNPTSSNGRDSLLSQTSQSNLHMNATTTAFGTSPFSAPGSKGLYMPFTDSASSSVTSQSNMHANLSGGVESNIPGYPASFAGSRAFGWSASGPRRPSLPGHNQRPSLGALSAASGVLDESALEEEEGDGEEFLPSSLNDLLTKEERDRRYSRTGGRPQGESMAAHGGQTEAEFEELDEPMMWNQTIRRVAQNDNQAVQHGQTNDLFSRSVPATSLLGNVRQLWQNEAAMPSGGLHTSNDMSNQPQRTGLARALSSNQTMPYHAEELMPAGSYGPSSSSMLASSLASNASNAFLRSSRAGATGHDGVGSYGGGDVGVMRFEVGQGLTSSNDIQMGGITASYNPQSTMFQHQQPSQRTQQSQIHQQRSSLSGLTSTLMQAQNQSNQSAYPMYSGPADTNANLNSSGFGYMHQQQQPAPVVQPHRQPLGPGAAAQGAAGAGPNTGLRHEPGQSLPRGLGAGLSRIHLVPAMGASVSSGVGSPGSGVSSPNFLASPPSHGFGALRNGMSSAGGANSGFMSPGYSSGWPTPGADLNPTGDKLALSSTPTRNFGSGLTARMAAAPGVTSNLNNSRPVNDLQPVRTPLNMNVPRSAGPLWGNGPGGMGGNMSGNPQGVANDVEVDDGTLFSMD
ncbi:hypothetical protein FRB95_013921 [Tulasnella sp. JGI-2019a]|nr:hypothetical protein FRB95_013921 [Tulasnella sp. JGI-2019a]